MAEIIQHFKRKGERAIYFMSSKLNKDHFFKHTSKWGWETEKERQKKERGKG